MRYSENFITIADLYRAYRKAKSDAFFEGMHFDAVAFTYFEKALDRNLRTLHVRLRKGLWMHDQKFIGGYSYAPKGIVEGENWEGRGGHFSTLDRYADWSSAYKNSEQRADASFRLIIRASVSYQIISALWILKVGHRFEAHLDSKCSYGNRLRRHSGTYEDMVGPINQDCVGLFIPYFSAYRTWRQRGLELMRKELSGGNRISAITMDVKRFYHNVSPKFLLRDEYLSFIKLDLNEDQKLFTKDFLTSIDSWYKFTPDYEARPEGALPVGLSASKVISNVLLIEFDSLIRDKLNPVYYGRYVDDIFLVLNGDGGFKSSNSFMDWMSSKLDGKLAYSSAGEGEDLRFTAAYCEDSKVIFSKDKQKIFLLEGSYGLDLVDQIEEMIKKQSSEHRMLPMLPLEGGEMLARAFLATPDATLEADALRKADIVSVRRLGFSLLLSDVESYARDLKPSEWRRIREIFYGLVERHVVTPKGIFDYFAYLNRVFGLMVLCGDLNDAMRFLGRVKDVSSLVSDTSTAGSTMSKQFEHCMSLYAKSFMQAAIQASTARRFAFSRSYMRLLRHIKILSGDVIVPGSLLKAKELAVALLKSDLGRRPYKEYWYIENVEEKHQPAVPRSISIRKVLRLGGIKKFRKNVAKGLREPYWPAMAFPTRPLTVSEMTLVSPALLDNPFDFRKAIFSLRGARVPTLGRSPVRFNMSERSHILILSVPWQAKTVVHVAVVNFKSTDKQWLMALAGKQDRSLNRYYRINSLVNDILSCQIRADYVTFPEASIPRRWAFSMASRLSRSGVSLLAGMENSSAVGPFRNDALVSLSTKWPGYSTHIQYVQPKMSPAHHEAKELRKHKRKIYKHSSLEECRPIYAHGSHSFGLLLCSDLTNIDNRRHFQGSVDTLFALEWNRDTKSFGSLVEASALDLHAYVVQVNNRNYGDSRVRAPRDRDFERDVVRLKGGESDYFVMAKLQIADLREFQSKARPSKKLGFKPVPIGFKISQFRMPVVVGGKKSRSKGK